jgi:hypothetical protein
LQETVKIMDSEGGNTRIALGYKFCSVLLTLAQQITQGFLCLAQANLIGLKSCDNGLALLGFNINQLLHSLTTFHVHPLTFPVVLLGLQFTAVNRAHDLSYRPRKML